MSEQVQRIIGKRIRMAREVLGLTQESLSGKIGFKDRQILSNIESGRRAVSADELVEFAEALKRPLEFFTDTFSLAGEAAFSWRAKEAESGLLEEFEEKAGNWLAVYRRISEQMGEKFSPLSPKLNLTQNDTYAEADRAGEDLAQAWELGDAPALRLHQEAEQRLGVLVLAVDAPRSISGAACRLPEFNAILVNRQDPAGRRNYDFAHELFHVLTWDSLPPRHRDLEGTPKKYKDKRTETLADNFAAGLLMPKPAFEKYWQEHQDLEIHARLIKLAEEFGVTAQAVRYRAQNLKLLSAQEKAEITDHRLTGAGPKDGTPPPFSRRFVEKLGWALEKGRLSIRRAAQLLGMTTDELRELFVAHGLEAPFEV